LNPSNLCYRIWYKKSRKKTGTPLCVWNVINNEITYTDKFEMVDCEIKIAFNNSVGPAKSCGATTILEVYRKTGNENKNN